MPNKQMMGFHKRIRLEQSIYREDALACSVTIAVRERRHVFGDSSVAYAAVDILKKRAEKDSVPVYGYCVMPDHVHLVLSPSSECDIPSFVGRYKNLSQRAAWRHGVLGTFWQKSFWDHFLRKDEDLITVVKYVLETPVRKGLADSWIDYPFSGSLVFQLR